MGNYKICCTRCLNDLEFPASMIGDNVKCPECGNSILLSIPPAISCENIQHEASSSPSYPQPATENVTPLVEDIHETIPFASDVDESQTITLLPVTPDFRLPERMKANKKTLGKECSKCGANIELGDDLYNCQSCFTTQHMVCFEETQSCTSMGCVNNKNAKLPAIAKTPKVTPKNIQRVSCKYCGENISKKARKCRFCGEFQKASDRNLQQKIKKACDTDDTLSGGEIALGILCSGLACIVAIVYICQGKKKGGKLLIISIIVQVVLGLLRALLEVARN